VYITGELAAQSSEKKGEERFKFDWKKVAEIGMLGSAENGILMTAW